MNETQTQLPWWLPDPILIFFMGFLALMYFMTIRPQQKRMKALELMMDGLEKGDEVMTSSGLVGKIENITDRYVSVKLNEQVSINMQKEFVASKLPKGTINSIESQ